LLFVFDLDGTLVDSRRDLADSANAMLARFGAVPLPEDRVIAMVGDGAPMLVQRACAAAGLSLVPEGALGYFLEVYDTHLLDNTRPYPATHDVLKSVSQKATLAVLTNKPERASIRILEGTGLLPFFEHIVAGDGPWPRKPDPQGLEWLMSKTGTSRSSTVLVGDSIVDLRTARAAGVRICLARYGFGFDSLLAEQLHSDDRVIDSPSDLLIWEA
jgi:phosphoglycolate phosphatase